ncbi:MAG: alcohol dehydrogenase catalytic domain-containing protein, partial [Defluviitaleaceae bacterium]|nr:alcohol dehydrogenase catalytic domain-containing protein [Defluviitaleaceae bacterium]
MRAVYVKAPFEFEIREIDLRELRENEILVSVRACGVCGTDMQTASTEAKDFVSFGHEVSGVVLRAGGGVKNVEPGLRVALESSAFCRSCDMCRNGRPDLCGGVITYDWGADTLGFADMLIAPAELAVPIEEMPFDVAAVLEPMGVAMDLFLTADVKPGDDVLVIGLGPIGLLALKFAVISGANRVVGASPHYATKRIETALAYGASDIILTDLTKEERAQGGFDKVLVTAPPGAIPSAIKAAKTGGTVAYIG